MKRIRRPATSNGGKKQDELQQLKVALTNITITVSGLGTICPAAAEAPRGAFDFSFHPTDTEGVAVTNPKSCKGRAQLLRDGTLFFTAAKKRIRNKKLQMGRALHGCLSATRDLAMKLTLRVPFSEQTDWRRAFVTETITLITPFMGRHNMRLLLEEMLNQFK